MIRLLDSPRLSQWFDYLNYVNHHHHHHRIVRVDRCAAPWPLPISDLHSVDSGRALASSWTLLSQTLWGRPGGLLQLAIAFLPSYVSTIRRRASCAGTPGSRHATWPNRDNHWWCKMSPTVDYVKLCWNCEQRKLWLLLLLHDVNLTATILGQPRKPTRMICHYGTGLPSCAAILTVKHTSRGSSDDSQRVLSSCTS